MKFTYKIIIILLLFLLSSAEALAGTYYQIPKYVQSKSVTGSGTQVSLTLTGAITANNLLTAVCYWGSNTYTASVSDGTNNWVAIGSPQTGSGALSGYRLQSFYAENVSAGSPTIACDISGSVSEIGLAVHEVSGALTSSSLDQNDSGNTSGTTHTSPSVVTTQKAEYLFGGCVVSSGNPKGYFPWNLRESGNFLGNYSGDRMVPDIGSYNTLEEFTSSGDAICNISTFKGPSYSGTIYTPPAYVQGAANSGSGSSLAVSFSGNVTAGNVIAVAGIWYSTTETLDSITDNCNTEGTSNTYTLVNNPTTGSDTRTAMAYAVIGKTGSCTVTANLSGAANNTFIVHEISGVNTSSPLDQSYIYNQTSPDAASITDGLTSGYVNTTINGDYIFGFSVEGVTVGSALTAGTGFTPRQSSCGTFCIKSEDRNLQNLYGPISATFTTDKVSVEYYVGIMAFKPANAEAEAAARTIRLSGHTRLRGGIRLK